MPEIGAGTRTVDDDGGMNWKAVGMPGVGSETRTVDEDGGMNLKGAGLPKTGPGPCIEERACLSKVGGRLFSMHFKHMHFTCPKHCEKYLLHPD